MKIRFIIMILILFIPINAKAARGCCSKHGGINYCGSNGYYICNDGTESPSCTCDSYSDDNDNNYIELTDTSCYYEPYINKIDALEKKVNELEKEKKKLTSELEKAHDINDNILAFVIITIIGIMIYKIYKHSN